MWLPLRSLQEDAALMCLGFLLNQILASDDQGTKKGAELVKASGRSANIPCGEDWFPIKTEIVL